MTYQIKELSALSGVSPRTLRFYEEKGLLTAGRHVDNGYRLYDEQAVNRLQQILFYRALEVPLAEIKILLDEAGADALAHLERHHLALLQKKKRVDVLLASVEKSIRALKGEVIMTDIEKFEGFKEKLITDNEKKYGKELREKYGDTQVNTSYQKVKGVTQAQLTHANSLEAEYKAKLQAAFLTGDAKCELSQQACALHEQWLRVFVDFYSPAYHKGLADMYVADERFAAHYEVLGDGVTAFFREAIYFYCDGA